MNSKGSITVAAAVILSCIILLNIVLYDYVKMKATISCIPQKISLACNSVLGSYDALLAEKYGIYGYNTSSGHYAHKEFSNFYGNTDCIVNLKNDFTNPEIIKQQICGIMKLKTPVNMIETVLKAFDVISESDEICDDNSICGKAAQKLSNLQSLCDKLKIKVEGYFSGDSGCVNGFSQRVAAEIATSILSADEASFEKIMSQVISLHSHYKKYNEEAAAICNEIKAGVDEINGILAGLDMSSQNTSGLNNASLIKQQAQTLLNRSVSDAIKHNCDVFEERIALFVKIKQKGYGNINEIKSVVEQGKIHTNIQVNTLHIGDTQGYNDNRKSLTDDINNQAKNSVVNDDTYEIPSMEYAALPSVKSSRLTETYKELINTKTDGFIDKFSSFEKIFSFWDKISFNDLLKNVKDTILIDDYIMTYMTSRLSNVSDNKLNNEIEYIIGGNASCDDNNDVVEQKIVILRFIINFVEIMKSKEKVATAEAMATAIAVAISCGAGVTLYKYIIISAWSLIDSYADVEKLLKGESVPLIKFGDNNTINDLQDYSFYLRVLLLTIDRDTKLLRICDMIEINMQEITGEKYKLSGVYNTISVKVYTEFKFISPVLLGIKEQYKREDSYELSY